MALVSGTNCGFVTTAPTNDPDASANFLRINDWTRVSKYTSSATAGKITEMGWWCDAVTNAANFEVGIYAADGAVVPGEAGTLLQVSRTNAKGTTAGWKVVSGLNWAISGNTTYWLAIQLDDHAGATSYIDGATSGFNGYDVTTSQTTLTDPFGGGAIADTDATTAIYAVWEEAAAVTPTFTSVNIGDVWKTISGSGVIKVNIGDSWKNCVGMQVNVGDVWKNCIIS
jgi:hypothetical protein